MKYLMFLFILANLSYLLVKFASEVHDDVKAQYRYSFMFAARLLPLLAYGLCLGILILNYLSFAHPEWELVKILGMQNALLLTPQENLFLLAISAFLITPAAPVIAISMLLHLSVRVSLLYLDGVAQHSPSYFILMGALSVMLISIDKFSTEQVPWLRRVQKRLRSIVLYTLAIVTMVAFAINLRDPESLRHSFGLAKHWNMSWLLLMIGGSVMIGWYQVLISKRNKDTLLVLIVPSMALIANAFGINQVQLVYPLFTMVGLAICMHDDYCRDRIALAKKMRALDRSWRQFKPALRRG